MKYYVLECIDRKNFLYEVLDVTENRHVAHELCNGTMWRNYMSEHDFRQMENMELKRRDSIEMVEAIRRYLK